MANESDCSYNNENILKLLNKENTMKPEKVKSRWRRNSEMEIGEKSALSLKNFEKEENNSDVSSSVSLITESKEEIVHSVSDEINSIAENTESIPLYVELEENLYLFERKRTKRKKEVRRMLCECTLTKEEREKGVTGCGDECLNRLLMIECGSRCPTGDACSNKRFQKRLYAKVQPFKTEKKGWGLKLLENVPRGNFVIEYVGEILSRHDFKQRVKQYAREKSNHYYFMALKTDEIIDATNKGNLSRFMNHSCDPNCETQKWTVNGELRIGFFAKRDLKAGEELTFDYQFQRYGREAQKCYCESELCSGYIGVSNEISLDVTNKTINKRKKGPEVKKREVLEDLILEEEIEKLCENSGLRNKAEILILARLMVRAEDFHSRNKLLDVILATSDIGYLRIFVDYHGLSLLWSWMVDLMDSGLKLKILQVLSILPVPNKTMLLESKVYNIVERWASDIHANELHGDLQNSTEISSEENYTSVAKKLKTSDTSDSETDAVIFQASESVYGARTLIRDEKINMDCGISSDMSQYIEEGSVNSIINSDNEESSAINGNTTADVILRSDEESSDTADMNKMNNSEIVNFAHNLLSSWKDLKEDFRIPRREHQKQKCKTYANFYHRRENDICKQCGIRGSTCCKHKLQVAKDFNRFSKDKNKESFSQDQEKSWEQQNSDVEEKPRKVLLPTPILLTKEERRLRFEKEVLENDQRKALRKQQEHIESTTIINGCTNSALSSTNNDYSFSSNDGNYFNSKSESYAYSTSESSVPPFEQQYYNPKELQSIRPALLPTPGTINNTLNNTPLPSIENGVSMYSANIYHSSHAQIPVLGSLPPVTQQSNNLNSCQNNNVPPSSNLIVVANMNSSPAVPTVPAVKTEPTVPTINPILQSSLFPPVPNSGCVPGPNGFPTSSLFPSYMANPNPYVVNQNGGYYPQQQITALSEQIPVQPSYTYTHTNGESSVKPVPSKLPPNWKTATDSEGNIYYYHILTRQTQWDPPICDETTEIVDGDTPTYDEPLHKHSKKKSTTTAAADTSSNHVNLEIAKKIKELFRTKMSTFVVQCLNPYHRDDCRVGKIMSNEDFKYLARKLTHFVMAKELKHCKCVEDLECNENVKHKARDFIHKYMSKYGPIYKKGKFDSPIVY
ncbi:histone-lysine N-methyltransferase SETD2-like isoform X2 [Argiope bruennichi]|uniref:histone-lysine N-methyltransferase SETD2-like isoform X2 n=1 Tax=Argiope bruennichi TaxID=94029 RepID=UPI002494CE59|nr:histone-lysine N-methyltransferase SETD2-like isoform X2 [Argiope bruennichi]